MSSLSEKLRKILEYLIYPDAGKCHVCSAECSAGVLCENCAAELKGLKYSGVNAAGGRSAYVHAGRAREAVLLYKFEGGKRLFALMAEKMAPLIPEGAEVITYVPLHRRRRKQRGYDQARLIAEELSRLTGIPAKTLLVRTRYTAEQSRTRSAKERKRNIAGAFSALFRDDIRGKNIVIVDDVITTGATVNECRSVLVKAGAKKVAAISFTAV